MFEPWRNLKLLEPLLKLRPFVDKGLLRVRGRIDQALLPYDSRHSFILSGSSFLSKLNIKEAYFITYSWCANYLGHRTT